MQYNRETILKKMSLLGIECVMYNSWCIVYRKDNLFGFMNTVLGVEYKSVYSEYVLLDHFFVGVRPWATKGSKRTEVYIKSSIKDALFRYKKEPHVLTNVSKDTKIVLFKDPIGKLGFINYNGKIRKAAKEYGSSFIVSLEKIEGHTPELYIVQSSMGIMYNAQNDKYETAKIPVLQVDAELNRIEDKLYNA